MARRADFRPRAWLTGAAREAVASIVAAYVRLCWRTTRWRLERGDAAQAALDAPQGFLAAFWHGRVIFSPLWAVKGRRTWAVISANRDGDLIAAMVRRFGIDLIRGSSADPRKPGRDKGGRKVMVESIRALRAGDVVAIAVDGPRGPRQRAQPGVAVLSATAGAPVVPLAFSTRRGLRLGTWDRFMLPLPFDRGAMLYGEPIAPPETADPPAITRHLAVVEATLTALTERADRLMGRASVEPAEAGERDRPHAGAAGGAAAPRDGA